MRIDAVSQVDIVYDGTDYVGWQVQPNGVSIQEKLESAWRSVTSESIRITASGRTDAGVHAWGQVCSLSTESDLDASVLVKALNANLPGDINVLQVEEAATNFHAIRDAIAKTYRYQIQFGPVVDVFSRRYSWHIPQSLNVDALRSAGKRLVGRHDFASFQASGSDRATTVRTIESLTSVVRSNSHFEFVDIEVTADGFLYNMVRNIVGSMIEIGLGKQPVEWISEVVVAQDRRAAGPTAPARGLFLVSVRYDYQPED